jgi:hypothetical protein
MSKLLLKRVYSPQSGTNFPCRLPDHAPVDNLRADIARLATARELASRQERYNPPKLFDQAQDPEAKVRPDFSVR